MDKYIIAVKIIKVQSCLFNILHAHVQEKQKEENTLRTICNLSTEISTALKEKVEAKFEQCKIESNDIVAFPSGSGDVVYRVEMDDFKKAEMLSTLDELFVEIYRQHQGRMRISYAIMLATNNDYHDIKSINELLKKQSQNEIIQRNANILFNFQTDEDNTLDKDSSMHLVVNSKASWPFHAENLGELRQNTEDPEERFRLAMIKADFDGMYDLFNSLENIDQYKYISKILSDRISIEGLYKFVKDTADKNPVVWENFKLFPLYIAGDDIFFAVHVSNLILGIHILRELVKAINNEIMQQIPGITLTLRIGVDITWNSQPIRYYYERVEVQMNRCKTNLNDEHDETIVNLLKKATVKIALDNCVFYDTYIERRYKQQVANDRFIWTKHSIVLNSFNLLKTTTILRLIHSSITY